MPHPTMQFTTQWYKNLPLGTTTLLGCLQQPRRIVASVVGFKVSFNTSLPGELTCLDIHNRLVMRAVTLGHRIVMCMLFGCALHPPSQLGLGVKRVATLGHKNAMHMLFGRALHPPSQLGLRGYEGGHLGPQECDACIVWMCAPSTLWTCAPFTLSVEDRGWLLWAAGIWFASCASTVIIKFPISCPPWCHPYSNSLLNLARSPFTAFIADSTCLNIIDLWVPLLSTLFPAGWICSRFYIFFHNYWVVYKILL